MPNLYVSSEEFRARFVNSAALSESDEAEVLTVIEAASRQVDNVCERWFYPQMRTLVFNGNGLDHLWIPDLLSATSIKLDRDGDGIFETTLSASDYWLTREEHWDPDGLPKTMLRLNPKGSQSLFPSARRLVQIVGKWGFAESWLQNPYSTLAFNIGSATLSFLVNDAAGLMAGQTILMDSEQMFITRVDAPGLTVYVMRGLNGTIAASHTTGTPFFIHQYEGQVVEATMIQSGRYWRRRESSYSTIVQNPGLGTIEMYRGVDTDVRQLLHEYKKTYV